MDIFDCGVRWSDVEEPPFPSHLLPSGSFQTSDPPLETSSPSTDPSFRRGVLTEAALALEAEVQARPDNAEAWRLLGTVQAENDDDQQVRGCRGV